jgi:hypothetical protein
MQGISDVQELTLRISKADEDYFQKRGDWMRKIGFLLLTAFATMAFSQDSASSVTISGRVTDPNGKPLTNTLVRMGVGMLYTTTDSNGYYALGVGKVNVIQNKAAGGNAFVQPEFTGGKVLLSLPQSDARVRVSMYDLGGRFVKDILNGRLAKGNYAVSVDTRNLSSRCYLLRITINGVSYVLKVSSLTRGSVETAIQSLSGTEGRLEKLAAVVDTLHATEPGYSLGITPITSLSGTYNFTLTKNNTWDGDTAGFWGDTAAVSAAAKAAGHFIFKIINKTNGTYPDSMIYWADGDGGTPVRLSDQSMPAPGGNAGRLYIMVGYNAKASTPFRPMNQVWDFEEHNYGTANYEGNLTRVDWFGTPLAMRLHSTDGTPDQIRGEIYPVFFEPRQAIFDEFVNEVPWMWDSCATYSQPWKITDPCEIPTFSTGGSQAHYWDNYEKACGVTAGACVGINDPNISSGLFRHVLDLPAAEQPLWKYQYQKAPCSYYAYFIHRRAFYHLQYAFPYDDDNNWSSYITSSKAQWLIIAVGY